jgi:hypothetical protein
MMRPGVLRFSSWLILACLAFWGCQPGAAYQTGSGEEVGGSDDVGSGVDGPDSFRDAGSPQDVLVEACEDQCEVGRTECISDLSYRTCGLLDGCAAWYPLEHCEELCVDGRCVRECIDFDQDGRGENCELGPDCDDRNPFRFDGNPEVCDGHDNDCDGNVDEGGVCDEPCDDECTPSAARCNSQGVQYCTEDLRGCLLWGAARPCRDDLVCVGGECQEVLGCVDRDGDGFGRNCEEGLDCDDTDGATNPEAAEVCNGRDDDCNGRIDDACTGNPCEGAGRVLLAAGRPWSGTVCPATTFRIDARRGGAALLSAAIVDGSPGELTVHLRRNGLLASAEGTAAGIEWVSSAGAYNVELDGVDRRAVVLGWTYVAPDCAGDSGEPNNSPTSTAPLFPGRGHGGSLCRGDLDFFAPVRPRQWIVDAELVHSDPTTLLELWLDGVVVTPDQRRGANRRHVHLRTNISGDYALGVRGVRPSVEGGYLLTLSARPIPACQDDAHENNDTLGRAVRARGRVSGTVCAGDADWYEIGRFTDGAPIRVVVDFDAGDANLDAWLFVDGLNGFAQLAYTDRAPEILPTNAPSTGNYYVLVMGRTSFDTADYTVSIE